MARSAQTGVHGRTRKHIVAMGGLFAERFDSTSRDVLVSQDKFLALLLRNGAITEEQLRRAIDSYRRCPQDYAWILQLRHVILDKADKVFFVLYGRFPTENSDFFVHSQYYEICRNLQLDPDSYDRELRKLAWDRDGKPRIVEAPPEVVEAARKTTSKKGDRWSFILILLVSLASAVAVPLWIAKTPMPYPGAAVLAAGLCWLLFLAGGLIVNRPRSFETEMIDYSCSECHGPLGSTRPADHCPHCGIRFEER